MNNNFKVILQSSNSFNVKFKGQDKLKIVSVSGGFVNVPVKFEDLIDVDINTADKQDKYVVMYNAAENEYRLVNPDEVLSAATTEPIQPGLPTDFTNQLDIDLDDKIDLDAGTW